MKLDHPQITWEEIPKHEDVVLHPVEQNYKKVLLTEWAILWLIGFAVAVTAIFFFDTLQSTPVLLLIIAGVVLLSGFHFFSITKSFPHRAYAMREHDVLFQKGWLFQQLHIVPLSKIQHCVIKKGPLERKYKLASLQLFTAANSSFADIKIGGLTEEQAERLKEWALSKQMRYENS
jgi:membrane protein YdbS with pleckstrin-like domain